MPVKQRDRQTRTGYERRRATASQGHERGHSGEWQRIFRASHMRGFFISGSGSHPRHVFLLNHPEGLTLSHTAPSEKSEVRL